MKKLRIKLIKLPNIEKNKGVLMPDLGLGILLTILRNKKFDASQIDLKPLFHQDKKLAMIQHVFSKGSFNKYHLETILGIKSPQEDLYNFVKDLVKKYDLKNFDVLGFSLDEETDLLFNLSLIKIMKDLTKKIIILGGSFKFTRGLMERYKFIDFTIRGDATISLSLFLSYMEGLGNRERIPGLMFRKGQKIVSNPYLRQAGNVDIIPDFTDLSMDDYRLSLFDYKVELPRDRLEEINVPKMKIAILPYHFIKGCPNSCRYCYWNREKLFKVTHPERVADNLQAMKEKYKVSNFLFLNNAFNPTLSYAEKVITAIKKRKLDIFWSDSVHPNALSKDIFPGLRESGCKQLYFGLESLSPRILKVLNRPSDPSQFSLFLRESHKHNIFNGVNFLIGVPSETFADMKLIHDFIKKNNKYFEYYNINLLRIIPEFGISKDPTEAGISLKNFGSIGLRNPEGDPQVSQLLEFAGISERTSFFSFDEIGGLTWEKKNRQDIEYIQYLSEILDRRKKDFFEDIHFILYLNNVFSSKKAILKWHANNGVIK